jgi:hypothetical protein
VKLNLIQDVLWMYATPRKRRHPYGEVYSRQVRRFYVYGRGYNSELEAYVQVAKHYVEDLMWEDWRKSNMPEYRVFSDAWYADRYPARFGCQCSFCHYNEKARTRSMMPVGRGCWLAKMADYRKIAREIIVGYRQKDGSMFRLPLALPQRSA